MLETLTIINIVFAIFSESTEFGKGKLLLNKFIYFLNFVLLTLHDGLRWNMGVDWNSYYDFWNSLDVFDKYIFDENSLFYFHGFYQQDPFYTGFLRFIYDNISRNYTVFLLIFSFICYALILLSLSYLTQYSILSLSFIPGFMAWYSGSQRQFLANAIFLLALYCLENKKLKYFFIPLITLALMSHITVFFPLLFIIILYAPKYFKKFRLALIPKFFVSFQKQIYISVIFIFLLLGFLIYQNPEVILVFLKFIPLKSIGWFEFLISNDPFYRSPFLGSMRKIFNLTLFTYLFYSVKIYFKNKILLNYFKFGQLISLILYLFSLLIPQFSLQSRLDIYFGTLGIIVLSGKFFASNKLSAKYISLFFVISFFIIEYSRHQCLTLFHPYHFFFEENIPGATCIFDG